MKRKPYNTIKIEGKTYYDYSITIKGIVYDCSICRETRELLVNEDEYQGEEK